VGGGTAAGIDYTIDCAADPVLGPREPQRVAVETPAWRERFYFPGAKIKPAVKNGKKDRL
jgi:hypothetical protein